MGRVQASLGPLIELDIDLFLEENIDFFFTKAIEVSQERHIMQLDALIGLCMDLLALLQVFSHVLNVLLHRLSHLGLLLIQISLSSLILVGLGEHIDPMQPLDSLLELLVIIEMIVEYFIDFILELLHVVMLFLDLRDGFLHFLLHAFAFQLHIFDNQSQVLIDNVEVLGLGVHLGLLLLQLLACLHTWPNPTLQLLDLVVQHELEFFQLHSLSTILVDLRLLVLNRAISLLQLIFHALNVGLLQLRLRDLRVKIVCLLADLLLEVLHLLLVVLEFVTNKSQFTLLLHTFVLFLLY